MNVQSWFAGCRMVAWMACCLLFLTPYWVAGQSPHTEHTLKLDDGNTPSDIELEELGWLVGRWVGEGLGGECEEIFLPPWNNSMTGAFRYSRDGELVFSEFFSFVKEDYLLIEWNFPPSIPSLRDAGEMTHLMLRFYPAGDDRTRIRLTHTGWRDGEDWDRGYAYFERAWPGVLELFRQTVRRMEP